jgi:DNA-binding CsgD family transcriptional regulator
MVRVSFGMSNEDIAADLGCSPATVRTHVQNVIVKLHVRDRAHAVGLLYRTGMMADAL